jgi:hypothetical protein
MSPSANGWPSSVTLPSKARRFDEPHPAKIRQNQMAQARINRRCTAITMEHLPFIRV